MPTSTKMTFYSPGIEVETVIDDWGERIEIRDAILEQRTVTIEETGSILFINTAHCIMIEFEDVAPNGV